MQALAAAGKGRALGPGVTAGGGQGGQGAPRGNACACRPSFVNAERELQDDPQGPGRLEKEEKGLLWGDHV